jgi:hypothetical protein
LKNSFLSWVADFIGGLGRKTLYGKVKFVEKIEIKYRRRLFFVKKRAYFCVDFPSRELGGELKLDAGMYFTNHIVASGHLPSQMQCGLLGLSTMRQKMRQQRQYQSLT